MQDTIEKNEIALCKIGLSDKVVLDEFKRNKTLGELILIDPCESYDFCMWCCGIG